jgi:hypothetical protein
VTGSGDIAPDVPAAPDGNGTTIDRTLLGAFTGLIAVIVVAAMFMTAEYRRGIGVLAAWSAEALLAGGLLLRRRDA